MIRTILESGSVRSALLEADRADLVIVRERLREAMGPNQDINEIKDKVQSALDFLDDLIAGMTPEGRAPRGDTLGEAAKKKRPAKKEPEPEPEDEEEEDDPYEEFWVRIEDGGNEAIGRIFKEGGKWHEEIVDGDVRGFGEKRYMSYLKKADILQWLRGDYDSAQEVDEGEEL